MADVKSTSLAIVEKSETLPIKGGHREGSGRKPFAPTNAQREAVRRMSGIGLTQPQIAQLIGDGICEDTLVKYFGTELELGRAQRGRKLMQCAFNRALKGSDKLLIFLLKTQYGFKETDRHEIAGPNGGPIYSAIQWTVVDPKRDSEE